MTNQLDSLTPVSVSADSSLHSLSMALLRLSVSPVQADRKAIARLEREVGKSIEQIINELDSAEVLIEAIAQSQAKAQVRNRLLNCLKFGTFFAFLTSTATFIFQPLQSLPISFILGFGIGAAGAFIPYKRSE